jgi:hypothetical protein
MPSGPVLSQAGEVYRSMAAVQRACLVLFLNAVVRQRDLLSWDGLAMVEDHSVRTGPS